MKPLPLLSIPAVTPPYLATSVGAAFGTGFHDEERGGPDTFRWMGQEAVLTFPSSGVERYLEMRVFSEFHDLSQHLTVEASGTRVFEGPIVHGWSAISVPVPEGWREVVLRLSRIFPAEHHPGDPRTLGIRVQAPRVHEDPVRHAAIRAQQDNAVANVRDLRAGRVRLQSTPPTLGIDLHGSCNVKPPCVYCEWDHSKALEGDMAEVPFTLDTLREMGPFFDQAGSLVNCSIGEPFMMRSFDDLLDAFGNGGKLLEMTTNGQILTERNVQKLLGRPIDLYVSLDAATPLTYSRLRNDMFERILVNLRRLVAAKGGRSGLPRLHLVFMPMKCNVHELDDFVALCADIGADRLVLRPLNYSDSIDLEWERAGYRYVYKDELLPLPTLVQVSARAAELCRALGVPLADQMDFGGSLQEAVGGASPAAEPAPAAPPSTPPPVREQPVEVVPAAPTGPLPSLGAEQQPACTEPWTSLYILRRGVLPCCYGGSPIAPMTDYRAAWNGELMQSIRSELLQGRFHDYCLRSTACPIVRKSEAAAVLPTRQRWLMKARHAWWRLNRDTGGWPQRRLAQIRTLLRGGPRK
jgi:pyruvate-formate lyase-activating enzyme